MLTDKADIGAAFKQLRQHFGRLDGLINNAGMARPSPVVDLLEVRPNQPIPKLEL